MRWFVLPVLFGMFLIASEVRAATPSFEDFDRRAKAGERMNIVFFGASLTWGANATDPQLYSFRGVMANRLEEAYPQAHFKLWDGAIGGTGSQLGVFRFDRDVLRHKPDLVFLDFSANDDIGSANPETLASYESLVRRIILDAKAPVVQVIFPFQWNVAPGKLDGMLRRDAHIAISKAYHTAIGDAIALAIDRVKNKQTTLKELWPADGVHPGNTGYILFADAAWTAFQEAVQGKVVCAAPETMVYADTYMKNARVRVSTLGDPPAGWRVGTPNLTSAFFDMLMCRWLDDEIIASNRVIGPNGKPARNASPQQVARLRARFSGSMVMLFGESTPNSGNYHVFIDGKQIERPGAKANETDKDVFDAGFLAKKCNGNVHMTQVVAENLDPKVEHTLEIEPAFAEDKEQEMRLESICVAGGEAWVKPAQAGATGGLPARAPGALADKLPVAPTAK